MKDYITNRIAELEVRLKNCQSEKKNNLSDFDTRINDNLILMYVFAITELEKCLE